MQQSFTVLDRQAMERTSELQRLREINAVRLQYGDAAAQQYEQCRLDRKNAANQATCQKLVDSVDQRWTELNALAQAATKRW